MVSMQDIADRVGVSKSAVSFVLNGKSDGRISEETKNRILQAARDLNYQINEVARSLRTGQSGIISVIVTDISNEFFGKLVFYVQEEAKRHGYLVLTVNTNENDAEFADAVGKIMGKHVDGIISVTPPGGADTLLRIQEARIPLVLFDRKFEDVDADYVGVDNFSSAKDAVGRLIAGGCRDIAFVGLGLDAGPLRERRRGYEAALEEAGLSGRAPMEFIRFEDKEEESEVRGAMREFLSPGSGVDAVFFSSRRVFTQAMNQIPSLKGRLRKDVRLLCFDDVSSYLASDFSVSYVEQPIKEMAGKAFELLEERIGGSDAGYEDYIFNTRCV